MNIQKSKLCLAARLTQKDSKGSEWHIMMGIYYLFEDFSQNLLMKIRMIILNSCDYQSPGWQHVQELSNSTMDSDKHTSVPKFSHSHILSLQALDRSLDNRRHTEPFTSVMIYPPAFNVWNIWFAPQEYSTFILGTILPSACKNAVFFFPSDTSLEVLSIYLVIFSSYQSPIPWWTSDFIRKMHA